MTRNEFDTWLEAHLAGLITRTARTYRVSRDDAEDIVHDTLTHFYATPDVIPRVRAATLPRYLARALKMRLRTGQRRAEVRERRLDAPLAAEAEIAEQISPEPPGALTEAIEQLLATISTPSLRTVAWLVYVCGWTPQNAAKSAGITLAHFRDQMRESGLRSTLATFVRRTKRKGHKGC